MPGVQPGINDEALQRIVRNYCRESGVRSLEKHIGKIARKIAFEAVAALEEYEEAENSRGDFTASYMVTTENLETYLGKPKYPEVGGGRVRLSYKHHISRIIGIDHVYCNVHPLVVLVRNLIFYTACPSGVVCVISHRRPCMTPAQEACLQE